jgi:subtilisin family serine protease
MFAVNVSPSELNALAADPAVARIYYDHLGSPALPQSVPLIGMIPAYATNATGARQAVAVIDTGVQTNHQFLSANVLPKQACRSDGPDFINEESLCPDGTKMQQGPGAADTSTAACVNDAVSGCSHGTHVAGIAAGNNTNPGGGRPTNGVAKNAMIVPIQVFTRIDNQQKCFPNPAPCFRYYNSDLISALEWVFQNALSPAPGVRLAAVNLSLVSGKYPAACDSDFGDLKKPIDMLRAVGVVTVVSSGNDGFTDAVSAPSCISTTVAVGSSTKQDVISDFSNMSSLVDLMAPGGLGLLAVSCRLGDNNGNILRRSQEPRRPKTMATTASSAPPWPRPMWPAPLPQYARSVPMQPSIGCSRRCRARAFP